MGDRDRALPRRRSRGRARRPSRRRPGSQSGAPHPPQPLGSLASDSRKSPRHDRLHCNYPVNGQPLGSPTMEWRATRQGAGCGRSAIGCGRCTGCPSAHPHCKPIDELIKTVLSQHTNDRNRDRALARLRERFPTWDEVRDAPVAEVEEAIRPGGLARQKAPRIQAILERARRAARPRLDRDRAARGVAGVPALPARGRAQNRRLRADLQLGSARVPGRRPHPPGRRPARPLPRQMPRWSAPTTRWLAIVPIPRTPTSCTST